MNLKGLLIEEKKTLLMNRYFASHAEQKRHGQRERRDDERHAHGG